MTVGGAGGGACRRVAVTTGGGAVGRAVGGVRMTGGGAAGCCPSSMRRNSSSQLVGRCGRGWPVGGAGGASGEESRRLSAAFFFVHAASAETAIRINAVMSESMRCRYFGCWPGEAPLPLPPLMLSRMPVSAWMLRIR